MIAISAWAAKATWYLSRGTGIVSLVLLTIVTVLGILNSVRWTPEQTPRFVLQRVHRNISLVVLVFIGLHVASAILDAFAPIRWLDAVIPFTSGYRPIWLGLGALAFDLLLAVAITSLLRARVGYMPWRVIHWTAYACWGIAVVHGLGTGSDSSQVWMKALVVVSVGSVIATAAWRLFSGWPRMATARVALAVGLVALPLVLGVWYTGGPLKAGWAARAGTPPELLPHTVAAPAPVATTVPQAAAAPLVLPASAMAQGTTSLKQLAGGLARVDVALQTSDSPPLGLTVTLNGSQSGQGVSMSDGSMELTPPRGAAVYSGKVTSLSGGNIGATLSDGHGDTIAVTLALQIAQDGQTVARISIQPASSGETGVTGVTGETGEQGETA